VSPVLLFLFALTLVFVAFAAVGVMWAIRTGQFDDLEGPAQRILMDDDDPLIPFHQGLNNKADASKMDK
jgi:cbb3-type cytochrome oxidase maturation protein